MSETQNETTELLDVEEMIDSLTGWEEMAIEEQFDGVDFFDLKGVKTVRALVFILLCRAAGAPQGEEVDGEIARPAKKAVMSLTLGQCNARFADPEDEATNAGKDGTPPA